MRDEWTASEGDRCEPNPSNWVDFDERHAKEELVAALRSAGATTTELWDAYSSVGGDMTEDELTAAVCGAARLTQFQYSLVSAAVNELIKGVDFE